MPAFDTPKLVDLTTVNACRCIGWKSSTEQLREDIQNEAVP